MTLDSVFLKTPMVLCNCIGLVYKEASQTVSIIKELNRRGVLANALAGRDEKEITRVLNFLIRYVSLGPCGLGPPLLPSERHLSFSLLFCFRDLSFLFLRLTWFIKQFCFAGICLSRGLPLCWLLLLRSSSVSSCEPQTFPHASKGWRLETGALGESICPACQAPQFELQYLKQTKKN